MQDACCQRVERKLRRCHDGGEELMKLKHAHALKPHRKNSTKKPAPKDRLSMNRSTEKISRNG